MARRGADSETPVRPGIAKGSEENVKDSGEEQIQAIKDGEASDDIVWWKPGARYSEDRDPDGPERHPARWWSHTEEDEKDAGDTRQPQKKDEKGDKDDKGC